MSESTPTLNPDLRSMEYDDENGSIFLLTKYNFTCGNNYSIRGFGLDWNESKKKVSFLVSCTNLKKHLGNNYNGELKYLNTNWNILNTGTYYEFYSTHYLDRHKVDCGKDYAIYQFNLEELDYQKIRYSYTCIKVPVKTCTTKYTKGTYGADKQNFWARSYFLSKQSITTSSDELILKSFKLDVVSFGKRSEPTYRYMYEECALDIK